MIKTIDELIYLNDDDIQVLIQSVNHYKLFVAISTGSSALKGLFYCNISYERISELFIEALSRNKVTKEIILNYQNELVEIVNLLINDKSITLDKLKILSTEEDPWLAAKKEQRLEQAQDNQALTKNVNIKQKEIEFKAQKTADKSLVEKFSKFHPNKLDDLVNLLIFIAEETSMHGFMHLEGSLKYIEEPTIRKAMQLIINGFSFDHIEDYILNRKKNLLREEEIKLELIKTGISVIISAKLGLSRDLRVLLEAIYKRNN